MTIRQPAVAGRFYPGNASALSRWLAGAAAPPPSPKRALGVVAPHAGYVYSGAAAGKVISGVEITQTVLLLGPNHTGLGAKAAIMSEGAWATPLGAVEIDSPFATALKAGCPTLVEDASAHAHEHSLEVMLPFLQYLRPGVKIVPIAFMLRSLGEIEQTGASIGRVLRSWPERVLMLASSDMTHYEPAEVARKKDSLAIERVVALDPEGLLRTVGGHGISMCGVVPTAVMLYAARELGASEAENPVYTNSGEASGDYGSVVGYAGMVVA